MKKMYKALAFAIAVLAAGSLFADEEYVYGYTWYYEINGEGAEITDIDSKAYGDLKIPTHLGGKPVVSLGGKSLFNANSGLTSVKIPDSVTNIGCATFAYCSNLTSVNIPDGVTTIGEMAFFWCDGLTSIDLPDSVTSIGDRAFFACTKLADADGFIIVRNTLFGYNGDGGYLLIPDGVTGISKLAFDLRRNQLTGAQIPDSVTSIGYNAFYGCSHLKNVKMPKIPIDFGAVFEGCPEDMVITYWDYALAVKSGNAEYGTVSGGGTFVPGTVVTIKATAKSGRVFAGWFTDKACTKPLNPKGYDNRSPTVKYVMPAKAMTVYAKFVTAAEAKKSLGFSSETKKLAKTPATATAGAAFSLKLGITSSSLITATATDLPKGLNIDKTTGEITGKATVVGDFTATVKVKDEAGDKITQEVKITVKAPSWAKGNFYGTAKPGKTGDPTAYLKFSVGSTGEVSGKVTYKGKAYSFTSAYKSCTASKATFAPKVKIGSKTFKPGTVAVKSQKIGGLSIVEAANSEGTFAAQKKAGLVKKGKALAKLVGKTFKFTKKTKNSGLKKSKDKLEVKLADGDAVKVSGVVNGKKLTALSWVTLVSGKATKGGSEVYTLYVDMIDASLKYERTLVITATVGSGSVKATAAFAK